MATADGYVLPKPGVPKTLGILSVIFSVILILVGLCGLAGTVLGPTFMQFADTAVKQQQQKVEADTKAQAAALDGREKAAKTDEEKSAIKAERDSLAASPKPPQVDMKAMTGMLTDPTYLAFTYVFYLTGLILQVLLLVAGIGLIRLTPWGRSLGVTWAGLQIAQVVILAVISFVYVQPKVRALSADVLAKMEADQKAGAPANPGMVGAQFAKSIESMAAPLAVLQVVLFCTYPTIMLILLNTAGARAACLPAKPGNPGLAEI